jgi:hypothetical protein
MGSLRYGNVLYAFDMVMFGESWCFCAIRDGGLYAEKIGEKGYMGGLRYGMVWSLYATTRRRLEIHVSWCFLCDA